MRRPVRNPGRSRRGWILGCLVAALVLATQVASAFGATQVYTGQSGGSTPDHELGGLEFFYPNGQPVLIDGNTAGTINFTIDGVPTVGYCVDTTRLFDTSPNTVNLVPASPPATAADRAVAWILLNRTPTGTPTADSRLQAAASQVAVWLLRGQVRDTAPTSSATVNAAAIALRDEALAVVAQPANLSLVATSPAAGARSAVITVTGRPGAVVALAVTAGTGTLSAPQVTIGAGGTAQVTLTTTSAGSVTVGGTTAGDGTLVEVDPVRDTQNTVYATPNTLTASTVVSFQDSPTVPSVPTTPTTPGTPGGVASSPRARLVITKVGPATARAGGIVTYTIRVTNRGNAAANSVRVTDRIPADLGLTSRRGLTLRSGSAVWSIGRLAPGRSRVLRISLRASRDIRGRRTNVATAIAAGLRPVSARAVTRFVPVPRPVQPAVTG